MVPAGLHLQVFPGGRVPESPQRLLWITHHHGSNNLLFSFVFSMSEPAKQHLVKPCDDQ